MKYLITYKLRGIKSYVEVSVDSDILAFMNDIRLLGGTSLSLQLI